MQADLLPEFIAAPKALRLPLKTAHFKYSEWIDELRENNNFFSVEGTLLALKL